VVEANQRGVPLAQTSIVDSALRRLPVLGDKDLGRTVGKDVPPWDEFAQLQFWRLLRWTVPANWDDLPRSTWPLGVAMLMGAVAYAVRLNLPYRFIVGLTALWGVVWIALMINLTHGHDYTMMYAVGIPLMLYTAVLTPLARWRGTTIVALVVAFVVFTYANFAVRTEVGDTRAEYTYDYQRINERMRGPRQAVHVNISDGECVIENDFCYVLGFYLNDHYLSDFEVADYVLGRLPTYHAEPVALPPDDTDGLLLLRDTLTPENTTAHLFDVAAGERRTIPDDAAEIVTFGESLTLQHWSVTDGVTVQPCERVHFESWWLTRETLPENYSMLLAMVDAERRNGRG
jgi:Ca2+/Na+ antiporter